MARVVTAPTYSRMAFLGMDDGKDLRNFLGIATGSDKSRDYPELMLRIPGGFFDRAIVT